jgi:uncharacterized lipoprotein
MKISYVLIMSFLIATLAGCSMGWTRPNTTETQFNEDRYQCEQQALSMYPVTMMPSGPGYQAPALTNCTTYGAETSCTTRPGLYTPAAQSDTNAFSRALAFKSCLEARGYTYKL